MRKTSAFSLIFAIAMTFAGCAPEDSLFPLYRKDDSLFDEKLNGAWRITESPEKREPSDGYAIFSSGQEKGTYLVRCIGIEKASGGMFLVGRLVPLGSYVFIDFSAPDNTEALELHDLIYPYVPSHIVGKVTKAKNYLRIDFLEQDWVQKEFKTGKINLAHVETPNGPILSASTEELRKFVLEHAEDEKAFSFTEYLVKD